MSAQGPAAVLARAWRAAALGAVAVGEAADVVEVVVPLSGADGLPVLALPFDRTGLAQRLAAAGTAALATWDPRLAGAGWEPLAARVRLDVEEDREGRWIDEGLLDQLLRQHPPARARLDTPLLRREHWWYVPRWVVRVRAVEAVEPLVARTGADDALLVLGGAAPPPAPAEVRVVAVDDWDAPRLVLRDAARGGRVAGDGPAALLAADVRLPGLDHTAELRVHGQLSDGLLHVRRRSGQAVLGRPPALWQRLRAALEASAG